MTKSSAEKPFDSVTIVARHYVPRPPPGFAASNIAAMAGHSVARTPSEGGPSVNESRDPQIVMSRVPRRPWSSKQRKDFRTFSSSPSPAGTASSARNPEIRPTYAALILRDFDD